ncbi:MAG: thrombospondin type 3 repeat-containing protein [Anaerolineae bacterium]|nr:thrombospondin type 3 repeat-containing protein [Anaerolineae bacterium]
MEGAKMRHHFLPHPRMVPLLLFLIVLSSLSLPGLVSAQQAIVVVQPISGPPGTTVSVVDQGGNRARSCFAQIGSSAPVNIGTMAGSISYVVPSSLAQGTVINFFCTAAGAAPSNQAPFTVTPPVVVDSDGDGLPDANDSCPQQAGPRENVGCPQQTVDSDGDGLPDDVDACPNIAGPRESGGCAPSPSPQPQIVQPQLPTTGSCVIATLDANNVNVREQPTTESAIVGALDPTQIYDVIGQNADGSWFQVNVNAGWVAGFVTRRGGDCTNLPQADGAPAPTAPQDLAPAPSDPQAVGLLVPAVQKVREAAARMNNCPELVPQLDALPTFLALSIVGEPDPCAAAQAEIDGLFLNPAAQSGPLELPECQPDTLPMVSEFVNLLNSVGEPTQTYLRSMIDDPPTYCLFLFDLYVNYITPTTVPNSDFVVPITLVTCDVEIGAKDLLAQRVESLGISHEALRFYSANGACDFYNMLRPLGSTPSGNVQLYSILAEDCSFGAGNAGKRAFSDAIRGAFDAAAAANQGCAGNATLESFPLAEDLQPALPQIALGDGECTGNYRMLATHNGALGMESLYRILKSLDPCAAADEYTWTGDVPFNVVPPPDCIQGDVMTLGAAQFDQLVLDASSPWFQKIRALDRPLDEMCSAIGGQSGGGFAVLPTATMGAFAANPTPTLPILVANPTATLPSFVGNPTATPEPGVVAPPTATPEELIPLPTETPQLPEGAVPPVEGEQPPGQGPSTETGGQGGGCFGCLPNDPVFPSGQAQALVVGTDDNGLPAIFGADASAQVDSETGQLPFVQIPLNGLPQPLPGYPVLLSPDGTEMGYFVSGADAATNPVEARQIDVMGPDGLLPGTDAGGEIYYLVFKLRDVYVTSYQTSAGSTSLVRFPANLTPAPYAPAWSADGSTLFMSLTDGTGVSSIYALLLEGASDTVLPLAIVQNAFAPAVAPNGRYIAFERNDANGRNIYAMALNSLLENPITQQQPGAECYGAKFGANSLKIFFTCVGDGERQMYVYGLGGVTPIQTGVAEARNPTPGETDGFIYFDDGQAVYLSAEDGSGVVPLADDEHEGWIVITSVNW